MIPQVDFETVRTLIEETDNPELMAALLEYRGANFKSVDPVKEMGKQIKKQEKELEHILSNSFPAAEAKKSWRFEKKNDGTIVILGYKGEETDVIVPAFIAKSAVSEIGEYVFSPEGSLITDKIRAVRKKLHSVEIPDSVTKIGKSAFEECEKLEQITLPNTIGKRAFFGGEVVGITFCFFDVHGTLPFCQCVGKKVYLCSFAYCSAKLSVGADMTTTLHPLNALLLIFIVLSGNVSFTKNLSEKALSPMFSKLSGSLISSTLEFLLLNAKACVPMDFTPSGTVAWLFDPKQSYNTPLKITKPSESAKAAQPLNAISPMLFRDSGRSIFSSFLQPKNASPPMFSRDSGRLIFSNFPQP